MGRATKAIDMQTRHNTKAEIKARKEAEEKLRGNDDKIQAPSYLTENQKKLFEDIVSEMNVSNILCNLDVYVLTECAIAIDRMREIENEINNDITQLTNSKLATTKQKYATVFFKCCNELCLSPQSRGKLANLNAKAQQENSDELLKILKSDDDD